MKEADKKKVMYKHPCRMINLRGLSDCHENKTHKHYKRREQPTDMIAHTTTTHPKHETFAQLPQVDSQSMRNEYAGVDPH